MAHFYSSTKGRRKTSATKCGDKKSGIDSHMRGWKSGVRVVGEYFKQGDLDCFTIYATEGSDAENSQVRLGYVQDGVFTLTFGVKNPLGKRIPIWDKVRAEI